MCLLVFGLGGGHICAPFDSIPVLVGFFGGCLKKVLEKDIFWGCSKKFPAFSGFLEKISRNFQYEYLGESLGEGSVAEGEYLRNMHDARICPDGTARWVEVCYCPTPLEKERPNWEQYFELAKVQDAHDRRRCRDRDGSEPWACGGCDCTGRLERKLETMAHLPGYLFRLSR